MRVAAFVGPSKSGKTTIITALIRRFVTEGRSVSAIKHTHHPLNEERRGDTGAFLEAGASPVIFAGDREAVIFDHAGTRRIAYASPADLLKHVGTDIVLVEGFKSATDWLRITTPISVEEATLKLRVAWQP